MELESWLGGYVQSYLERDVRSLLAVGDLARFQDFVGLTAAWSAQTVNLSRLGGDVGVTHPTARSWLSVMGATFVIHRLRPWHRNLGKRLAKTPKLYFWDTGLLSYLLRLQTDEHLAQHPLRGPIFETWVISELLKLVHHRGQQPDAFFYRDQAGLEVNLLLRRPDHWLAVEVKSASTVALLNGGDEEQQRSGVRVVPWHGIHRLVEPSASLTAT